MSEASTLHDIEIRPITDEVIFLTDRWGEPLAPMGDLRDIRNLAEAGLTTQCVETAMEPLGTLFRDEISFLVQRPGMKGPSGMAMMVEFEFAEEWQPEAVLDVDSTEGDLVSWKRTLAFHSPALLHVAKGLEGLDEHGALPRPIFDTSAFYNASIVVMLPLPVSTETFLAVHDLLFTNRLPWPPSAHGQIGAASQIRWRYDPAQIPRGALPGACLSFDGLARRSTRQACLTP